VSRSTTEFPDGGMPLDFREWLLDFLRKLEEKVDRLLRSAAPVPKKDWYTTEEFGQLVNLSAYQVREYCRAGRIRASRKRAGRGAFLAWVISHEELLRFQREGPLPPGQVA
jgi:hypothetical protein